MAISESAFHHLVIRADGTVWAWGNNNYGQLGDGSNTSHYNPYPVVGLSNVKAISARHLHSLAVKTDGTVWAWGYNGWGQLGDGTLENRSTPVLVTGLTDVVSAIACEDGYGGAFSLALKSDGTVWAWGNNDWGGMGDGTRFTPPRLVPGIVPNLDHVLSLVNGVHNMDRSGSFAFANYAVKTDGTVWTWGAHGLAPYYDTPALIPGLTGVVSVAASTNGMWGMSMIALKADGTVWHSTQNGYEPIPGLTSVVSIALGDVHTLALKTDGSVWAWGDNSYGQLGDSTYLDRDTPVRVRGIGKATAISTYNHASYALVDSIGISYNWRMILQNVQDGNGRYWSFSGTTLVDHGPLDKIPTEWRIAATPDLDRDGNRDILWHNRRTGETAYWLMLENIRVSSGVFYAPLPLEWQPVASADLDRDGQDDLIWQNIRSGEIVYWLLYKIGAQAVIKSNGVIARNVPTQWKIAAAFDMDRNGLPDLLLRNQQTGDMSYWIMNGVQRLTYGVFAYRVPTEWQIGAIADIDGDGDQDLIWQHRTRGDISYWSINTKTWFFGSPSIDKTGSLFNGLSLDWQVSGAF